MDKAAVSMEFERKPTLNVQVFLRRLRTAFTKTRAEQEVPMSAEKRALMRELDETLLALRTARQNIEMASSPEIIEAAIYEIKSAESRYGFLLRRAKQLELTSTMNARR